ncbi:3-oxosteroid 1-dehydrogenase [Streptomyces brasiliensis]|uniref:3-oxosteroid 1-dehydrogenase n=1 Tax=Streptomyces brasiliensis TaxID=1954 RepID=A0A917K2Y7_9ACTN|nr:3-oxosteroid 1-dehydrogenase [Streptomyces brasiliensis]
MADLVVVGSGGGSLCAALVARQGGLEPLVIEKTDVVGGSTAMSGGVLWLPDNPVSRSAGVEDSPQDARAYFASAVGDVGPSTSPERVEAFLNAVEPMTGFLMEHGVPFRHCEGYSDYYDELPGGKARSRSLETELFNLRQLGPWREKFRARMDMPPIPLYTGEVSPMSLGPRSLRGAATVAKLAGRMIAAKLTGREMRGTGAALQGWMLQAALRAEVPIWTGTPVVDLIVEDGKVLGVEVERDGRRVRVRARAGVLLNSGGFSHNAAMREKYGPSPASAEWTSANEGDTGEVIEAAMRHGAAVDLMEEAWWIPSSVLPDGSPLFAVYERSKPFSMLVDATGSRYVNEAASYMEVGQAMYARHKEVGAVPSWFIMDARHRGRYMWGTSPGGITPRKWIESGYMKKADTLEGLAEQCGIDPAGLRATVDRYNASALDGRDPEFHKGERAYDRYYGDHRVKPNPCVAPVEKAPFYAVALYPGDVGTAGGLLTDEHGRVLRDGGEPIPGLYATGNCTASVMGRTYPGAGASIAASFVFGWLATHHMIDNTARSKSVA